MTTLVSDDLDARAREVRRDGFSVLKGVLTVELVETWRRAFAEAFLDLQTRSGALANRGTGRYYATLPWRAPFADPDVWAHPTILEVVRGAFASDDFDMLQLAVDVPVLGSEMQEIHRDHQPLWGEAFDTPLFALAVNIPLVDVGLDNGPLEIAPGSHRMPKADALRMIASGELPLRPLTLERGDVVVRAPLALHRGTPNLTEAPRPMIVIGYALSWLHDPKVELRIPRGTYESFTPGTRARLRASVVDGVEDRPETYTEFRY